MREIWLGNVVVSALDVRRMKARMAGLERIVVRPHCLHVGLGGGGFVEDGMVWVEVDVEGDRVGLLSEVNNNEFSVEAVRGNYHMGGVEEGDRASMVLPFVLDLEPEEGGFL